MKRPAVKLLEDWGSWSENKTKRDRGSRINEVVRVVWSRIVSLGGWDSGMTAAGMAACETSSMRLAAKSLLSWERCRVVVSQRKLNGYGRVNEDVMPFWGFRTSSIVKSHVRKTEEDWTRLAVSAPNAWLAFSALFLKRWGQIPPVAVGLLE
jgi:hypothetical protein